MPTVCPIYVSALNLITLVYVYMLIYKIYVKSKLFQVIVNIIRT